MIEEILYKFLREKFPGTKVYSEIPNAPEGEYIAFERTGGGESEHIKNATIAIQSVSNSLLKAASLNEKVKVAMADMDSLPDICSADLNSDYNFTDPESKKYRYQAVFEIIYY